MRKHQSRLISSDSGVNLVWNLGESWNRVKKFWFSKKNSKKFRFFQSISQTKIDFSGPISEKFRFFQVISQKISTFQFKFPKNFDFFRQSPDFLGKFPKNFDFFRKFDKKIDFQGTFKKNFDFQAISQNNSIFQKNFPKISILFQAISQKIENLQNISMFFQVILYKIPIFNGKFTRNIDFPGKNWLYLQLFLGQLFYFSSKVTTFEHTSCTW